MAQDQDVSLKLLFRYSKGIVAGMLFGPGSREWINVEQPRVNNPRVDMLARCHDGKLRHVELEGKNRKETPRRCAEYYLGFHRLIGEHVQLTVLYLGKAPCTMPSVFETEDMIYRFRLIVVRDLDGGPLIASDDWGDNILALLTDADRLEVLRRVDQRLRELDGEERTAAVVIYGVVSGIIGIEDQVQERIGMITLEELMENRIFAPLFEQRLQQGFEQGIRQGVKLVLERDRARFSRLLTQRFGTIPPDIAGRIASADENELDAAMDRLLSATSIAGIFPA